MASTLINVLDLRKGWGKAAAEAYLRTAPEYSYAPIPYTIDSETGLKVAIPRETVSITRMKPEPAPYVPTKFDKGNFDTLTAMNPDMLKEYVEVAGIVGVSPPELRIEAFKAFLLANAITIFSLKTVVEFMDKKAKAESKDKAGWLWKALRMKDHLPNIYFGTQAYRGSNRDWAREGASVYPGSDHYQATTTAYDKLVPLHALKKVALIEKNFPHPVSFMVCDYAPAPAYPADPFLMAVIENPKLNDGTGRFVIDVWDEPGFGIEEMLKSDNT